MTILSKSWQALKSISESCFLVGQCFANWHKLSLLLNAWSQGNEREVLLQKRRGLPKCTKIFFQGVWPLTDTLLEFEIGISAFISLLHAFAVSFLAKLPIEKQDSQGCNCSEISFASFLSQQLEKKSNPRGFRGLSSSSRDFRDFILQDKYNAISSISHVLHSVWKRDNFEDFNPGIRPITCFVNFGH